VGNHPKTATMAPARLFHDLELPLSADMHVHLREGAMMETVTPLIEKGGVDCVFVMVSSICVIRCVKFWGLGEFRVGKVFDY
jgi:hypothetical protein